MLSYKILHKDGMARVGEITTTHGKIRTPAFIPVATKAAIKGLSVPQMDQIGFDALLCNTYHLYLQPGEKIISKMDGLHGFMGYNKPIFTDSGGFQVFSLNEGMCEVNDKHVVFKSCIDDSKHKFSPEKSMRVQTKLGADIIFAFDQCMHFDDNKEATKEAMERTHSWTLRCVKEFKKLHQGELNAEGQALFGIVQGGRFKDLREESARFISALNFPGYGIGGIFGDPSKEIHEVVKHTMQFLPEDKPKHMLGIGSVEDLFDYVEVGADTFDCVLPTRLARIGYFFVLPKSEDAKGREKEGEKGDKKGNQKDFGNVKNKFRIKINASWKNKNEPIDKNCQCFVCKNYSRAYLRHLFKAKELLFFSLATYHNLWYFYQLMEKIRGSIATDKFEKMKKDWLK